MRTETASKAAMVVIVTSFFIHGLYGAVVDSGSKAAAAAASINKPVAVEGVVFCMHCKNGFEAIFATLLPGAGVKLKCSDTKRPTKIETKTDNKGHFLIQAPQSITSKNAAKCKVSITKSPDTSCTVAMDYNGGRVGVHLDLTKINTTSKALPYVLYTLGPFSFEPKRFVLCP